MRFVSRVSFRRLGCDFAQVCEITGAGVHCADFEKPRNHTPGREITAPCEITPSGVKSQAPITGGVNS